MKDIIAANKLQDHTSTNLPEAADPTAKVWPNMAQLSRLVHCGPPSPSSFSQACTGSEPLSGNASIARRPGMLFLVPESKDMSLSFLGYFSSQTSRIPSSAVPPRSSSKSKLPRRSATSLPSSNALESREKQVNCSRLPRPVLGKPLPPLPRRQTDRRKSTQRQRPPPAPSSSTTTPSRNLSRTSFRTASQRSASSSATTRSRLGASLQGLPRVLRQRRPKRMATSLDGFGRVVRLQRKSPAGDGPTLRISEDADEVILGGRASSSSSDQCAGAADMRKAMPNGEEGSAPRALDWVAEGREIALLQLEGLDGVDRQRDVDEASSEWRELLDGPWGRSHRSRRPAPPLVPAPSPTRLMYNVDMHTSGQASNVPGGDKAAEYSRVLTHSPLPSRMSTDPQLEARQANRYSRIPTPTKRVVRSPNPRPQPTLYINDEEQGTLKENGIHARLSKIPVYAQLHSLIHRRRAKKLETSAGPSAQKKPISSDKAPIIIPVLGAQQEHQVSDSSRSTTAQLRADVQTHLDSMAPSAPKIDLALMLRVLNMSLTHATDARRGAEQARQAYLEANSAWQLCNHGVNAQMEILRRALERLRKMPVSPSGSCAGH